MNSLLDDNKAICVWNKERIRLGGHVKMVIKADDLRRASLSTILFGGMVLIERSMLAGANANADGDVDVELLASGGREMDGLVCALMDLHMPDAMELIVVLRQDVPLGQFDIEGRKKSIADATE
jgi:hypothetical protein